MLEKVGLSLFDVVRNTNLKTIQNIVTPDIKEVRAHKLKDFYPWPAPSPYDYRLPYSVIHVPKNEVDEFLKKVVFRYIRTIKNYSLRYVTQYSRKIAVEYMSDAEYAKTFSHSLFARFLNPLDTNDETKFFDYIDTSTIRYFKLDMTYVESVTKISEDMILVPTISILREVSEGELELVCIYSEGKIYTKNSMQWGLYKTFSLQAATMRILISEHPRCHFPMDAVVGASHCLFTKENPIYQLLLPHFYMQLPLNFAVLYISKSVALNSQDEIYTPFPCDKNGFLENLKVGLIGKKDNHSYSKYKFRLAPTPIYGQYGKFLENYWWAIYQFVTEFLEKIEINQYELLAWSDSLSKMIDGFPGPEKILETDTLARTLTSIIHNVSVEHSCDHYNYATHSRLTMPLRLRKSYKHNSRKYFLKGEDYIRHEMANEMYFQTHTITPLINIEYQLPSDFKKIVTKFKSNLRKIDSSLNESNRFIPLGEIASSIQF